MIKGVVMMYLPGIFVAIFSVIIVLTEAALTTGQGRSLAPVALLFQYLKLLSITGDVEY